MVDLVAALTTKAPLRKTITKDHAADVLHILLGPDLYWTTVRGRGWTERHLADWTERVILADLFGLKDTAASAARTRRPR
jgi:hypothetical protein